MQWLLQQRYKTEHLNFELEVEQHDNQWYVIYMNGIQVAKTDLNQMSTFYLNVTCHVPFNTL